MKKPLLLLSLVWLACSSGTVMAAENYVALVRSVSGSVKVSREGATLDVTSNTKLQIADHVTAAPRATAAIVFKDGTLLTLGGGADILVRDDRADTITADGQVEVRYRGRTLRADHLKYENKTGVVTAVGNVAVINPDGTAEFDPSPPWQR